VLLDQTVKAWFLPPGRIFYVRRDGTAMVSGFDPDSLVLVGEPVPVLEDVRADRFGLANLDLSAAGTFMYQVGSTNGLPRSEPVWVDKDGVVSSVDPGWSAWLIPGAVSFSLSPDGRSLALGLATDSLMADASKSIWVKRLDRGPLSRLTFERGSSDRVEWLPGGRRVSYAFIRDSSPAELWSRPADGTGQAQLELRVEEGVYSGIWSPDGRWLVVRTGGLDGTRDIQVLRVGVDSVPRMLLGGPYDERAPDLSPDGRWLAYVSNESGRDEVYVRPFPNVDGGKWQVSRNGGSEPLWAHSGRELFYRRFRSALVAVSVSGGTVFELLGERALFPDTYEFDLNNRRYDVTRDDRRFVFIRWVVNDSTAERHLTLVENWLSQLTGRVP
jgi:serine/threonine-protein kinase